MEYLRRYAKSYIPSLNLKYDEYEAEFSNLGLGGVPISEEYPEKYDRLLCGGIWCIINLEGYFQISG